MTVISLTTLPSRGARIEPVLDSLLAQGLEVYLWLPKRVERIKAEWDHIPEFFDKVRWEFVDDMGPATKLLPALERFDSVITADDDMVYGPGWAQGLIDWSEKLPGTAVAYRGRIIRPGVPYKRSKVVSNPPQPAAIGLITGVHGALYQRQFFSDTIFDEWRQCPTNDDVVVSAHLHARGVPMMVVPRPCGIERQPQWHTNQLYRLNRKRFNDQGIKELYWCTTPK